MFHVKRLREFEALNAAILEENRALHCRLQAAEAVVLGLQAALVRKGKTRDPYSVPLDRATWDKVNAMHMERAGAHDGWHNG